MSPCSRPNRSGVLNRNRNYLDNYGHVDGSDFLQSETIIRYNDTPDSQRLPTTLRHRRTRSPRTRNCYFYLSLTNGSLMTCIDCGLMPTLHISALVIVPRGGKLQHGPLPTNTHMTHYKPYSQLVRCSISLASTGPHDFLHSVHWMVI